MPDPILFLKGFGAAAGVAAAVFLLCNWPWRWSAPAAIGAPATEVLPDRFAAGRVLELALGFLVGCWILGIDQHWPPKEDQDRLIFLLFPAVVVMELLAPRSWRGWLIWPLRLLIAAGAAYTILYNSTYTTDLTGAPRQWNVSETRQILAELATALAVLWASLILLARLRPGRSVPLALAMTCAAAGLTVMLSGYLSGGQLGLPLGGALLGIAAASLVLPGPPRLDGALSLAVVGLFAILIMGKFFGELATSHAIVLFLAPLCCWLPELPLLRRARPWLRGAMRFALTAIPVAIVLFLAQQQFVKNAAENSADDSGEPAGSQDW